MKKQIYLICISLLGLGAVSCQKEKMTSEPTPSRVPIVGTARTPETKGAPRLNGLGDLADQDFGLSAWYTPEGSEFGQGSTLYIANHRFGTLDNINWQGISKGPEGKSLDPVYYPLDGSLSFFCYAPYRDNSEFRDIVFDNDPPESITSRMDNYLPGSPLIKFTPEKETKDQIDFMAANPVLNWGRRQGDIPVDFALHLTTKVQLHCKVRGAVNDEERIIISNVTLKDIIGSEYLYFTKEGDALIHKWCNDISPVDGSSSMPRTEYELSIENGALNNASLNTDSFTYINETPVGDMYLLPQVFKDEDGTADPGKYPQQLWIDYQIFNGDDIVESNTLKYELRGTEAWPSGKTVAYYITLDIAVRKDLIVETVVLKDWDNAQNTHNPEEILY